MVTTTRHIGAATNRPFSRPYTRVPAAIPATDRPVPHGRTEAVLALGIGSAALGLLIAAWPGGSIAALGLLLGIALAINAGAQVFVGIGARLAIPSRGLLFLSAALSAALAVLCLGEGNSVPMLSMWLGMGWAITGIIQATVAVWDDHGTGTARYEVIGIATMLTGILLQVLPLDSTTALRCTGAAALILLGAANLAEAGLERGWIDDEWLRRLPRP